jgi:hypothetical protein
MKRRTTKQKQVTVFQLCYCFCNFPPSMSLFILFRCAPSASLHPGTSSIFEAMLKTSWATFELFAYKCWKIFERCVNCLRMSQYDVHEKKERKMEAPIKKRKMEAPIKMERNDSAEKMVDERQRCSAAPSLLLCTYCLHVVCFVLLLLLLSNCLCGIIMK